MCLYPKLIRNPKYKATKKNGGNIPTPTDPRVMWVPIGCQKCMECRKQKARQWQVRLHEHIKTAPHKEFVTLTFSTESLKTLASEIKDLTGYELDNEIATLATRRFLERWRKAYGKSITHWLITELGHENTEHVHLHGILFTEKRDQIAKHWQYGYVYLGDYVNETTVNYIIKYILKQDKQHAEYQPKILTSPGIGQNYINTINAKTNKFNNTQTKETYTTRTGTKLNLPIYYRNKIYTEEQREKLWLQKLDKQERWVNGTKISIAKNEDAYYKTLDEARRTNRRLGYGDDTINWERRNYENQRRQLIIEKRIQSGQIQ